MDCVGEAARRLRALLDALRDFFRFFDAERRTMDGTGGVAEFFFGNETGAVGLVPRFWGMWMSCVLVGTFQNGAMLGSGTLECRRRCSTL